MLSHFAPSATNAKKTRASPSGVSGSMSRTASPAANSSKNSGIASGSPLTSTNRFRSRFRPVIDDADRRVTSGCRALTSDSGSPWCRTLSVTSRMDTIAHRGS